MTDRDINTDASHMTLDQLRAHYPRYKIRCGVALVRADERILFVKEKARGDFAGGFYGFPKGCAEANEHDFETVALRELREETGIILNMRDIEGTPRMITYHKYFHEIFIVFLTSSDDAIAVPDRREISECVWMSLDEIKKSTLPMSAFTKSIIGCINTLCAITN
jgi:8-oxo-dGTP pyrophosphatase MutT (NUDIX family)